MTRSVYAKHPPYDNGHLGRVVEEMRVQGAPTIRVVEFCGNLYAMEGSHRLAAAHHLGLVPKFVAEVGQLADEIAVSSEHWTKVAETLPEYRFEEALLLDLKDFKQ